MFIAYSFLLSTFACLLCKCDFWNSISGPLLLKYKKLLDLSLCYLMIIFLFKSVLIFTIRKWSSYFQNMCYFTFGNHLISSWLKTVWFPLPFQFLNISFTFMWGTLLPAPSFESFVKIISEDNILTWWLQWFTWFY